MAGLDSFALESFFSFTPGFSPVVSGAEIPGNRFNGFHVRMCPTRTCSTTFPQWQKRVNRLKLFCCFCIRGVTGLKPGLNERWTRLLAQAELD